MCYQSIVMMCGPASGRGKAAHAAEERGVPPRAGQAGPPAPRGARSLPPVTQRTYDQTSDVPTGCHIGYLFTQHNVRSNARRLTRAPHRKQFRIFS